MHMCLKDPILYEATIRDGAKFITCNLKYNNSIDMEISLLKYFRTQCTKLKHICIIHVNMHGKGWFI